MWRTFTVIVGLMAAIFAHASAWAAGTCTTGALAAASAAGAGTISGCWYVDITNGADSNNGTSEATAWAHAPGMANCTGTCNSTTVLAGQGVILRGGESWLNASFSWIFPAAGSSGSPIYVGVDKTWYAGGSWTRPIFNLGDTAPTDTADRIILLEKSYIIYDNFEIENIAALPSTVNQQTDAFDWYDNSESHVTVENMYIHDWVNPYFSIGTGNLTSGQTSPNCTVTNYVPYSYSTNLPTSAWASSGQVKLQNIASSTRIPIGNGTPLVTAVSGSNPYTITFSNTAGCPSASATGVVIQIGGDFFKASGGVEGTCAGCIMLNNVIDGSDTAEAQLNPYSDCGATESNNQFCVTSGTAGWREPNIWRGNVIQYVQSAFVGECSEWSNNLIQNVRLGTDPTGHTNGIECLDETASNNIYYNNVLRHTNNPNASVPGGQWSIGLFNQLTPQSGYTDYVFNNVTYDGLQNVPWGLFTGGNGCCGTAVFFNNTSDGGPSWTGQSYDMINTCPSLYLACTMENDHLISNIGSSNLNSCGSNCTHTTNLLQSFSTASGQGYTSSQTPAAYYPTTGGSTVLAGTNINTLCTTLAGVNAAAETACESSTGYAGSYNATAHTISFPAITENTRATSGAIDIGAYLLTGSASTYSITISSITGHGTVTDSQSLLNCTTGTTGTCSTSSATGSDTLTFTPSAGYSLGTVTGCTVSGSTCTVTTTVAITATFTASPTGKTAPQLLLAKK